MKDFQTIHKANLSRMDRLIAKTKVTNPNNTKRLSRLSAAVVAASNKAFNDYMEHNGLTA